MNAGGRAVSSRRGAFLFLRIAAAIFLAIIVAPSDSAFADSRNSSPTLDPGREIQYWKDVHRREYYRKLNEKVRYQEQREDTLMVASNLVREGKASASAFAARPDEGPSPAKPSIFDGKGQYILVGLTFILAAFLTTITLIRHKREAVIRRLAGKYLADGREAARFKMPALFEEPLSSSHIEESDTEEEDEWAQHGSIRKERVDSFFAMAPQFLASIRKLLPQLRRSTDEAERRRALLALREFVCALKEKADCWDLRPVWQLTSALELLLQRLAEKGKDATPSTIRTVAAAMDLLASLCVPGIRPDLIINPPIAVMAVDDDPLCLRAVTFALQKAEMKPDVAQNGEGAIILATDKAYDVIFMDIQMPRINGLTACAEIHKLKKNSETPVVFVTVQSDFQTRAQSSLVGGSDLMTKPFLMFEITVKALTLAMRKRLQLAESLQRATILANPCDAAKHSPSPSPTVSPIPEATGVAA